MNKTIAIVQARMGSTRLPCKSLALVWKNMTLLEMVLRRTMQARTLGRVILATTMRAEDDCLVRLADTCDIGVFRGSENNVLKRFNDALYAFPADAVVRVCADNPLIDPQMIDKLVEFYWKYRWDYITSVPPATGLPDGVGAEIFSTTALRRAVMKTTDKGYLENVTTYFQASREYSVAYLGAGKGYHRPNYRLDIDYPEDLTFIQTLLKHLPPENAPYWTTKEVIETLDKEPELLKLRKER